MYADCATGRLQDGDVLLNQRIANAVTFAQSAADLLLAEELPIDPATYEATPDKLVAELAIFADVIICHETFVGAALAAQARLLAQSLVRHARSPRLAIACLAHPGLAFDYLAGHILLKRCGFTDDAYDGLLAQSHASDLVQCRERLPHRQLEQVWLHSVAGFAPAAPIAPDQTILGAQLDVLFASRDDVYAFTHALMYVTDFGRTPLGPEFDRDHLCQIAEGALVAAMDDDDFDLAAELLMTWPFADRPFSQTAAFSFEVLCRVEDEVGMLPSFSLDGREHADLPKEARPHYRAAAGYHTVCVMGLLCSLLQAKMLPVLRFGGHGIAASNNVPETSGRAPRQWERVALAMSASDHSLVQGFQFDAQITRAARAMNLALVRQLLIASQSVEGANLVRRQAAWLLKRMASPLLDPIMTRSQKPEQI